MGLVQLTLPDDPAPQRERRNVVGIDLGTTNSLVATVSDGTAKIISSADGERIMPSVVRCGSDKLTVGSAAASAAIKHPDEVVWSAKRLIGRSSQEVKEKYPFAYTDDDGPIKIVTSHRTITPVEVSAAILLELVARANAFLDGPVEAAVITVPAYFHDAQRQATKNAAALAGIKVLRLLNEPTAAALAYGLDSGEEGVYVVYDLGGGTFDVSVLELQRGLFKVLATAGDTKIGGDDFDAALAQAALTQTGFTQPEGAPWRNLVRAARTAKERLSGANEAQLDWDGGGTKVTVAQLNAAGAPLVKRTIEILQDCLREAKVGDRIRGVIMVGGSTRMPQVRSAVAAAIDAPLHTDINPDEVVATGAAAQADILAGNRPANDWLLLDVTPLSLGIETMGGLAEKIITRNSPIPIARAQEFTTHRNGQSAMSIHVVQGERELVSDCRSLARFSVRDIPPMAAGTARVRVTYRLDADGILIVTAKELTTGAEQSIEVKPSYGLSEQEIARMLQASRLHAEEDVAARRLAEAKATAESLLQMLTQALQEDEQLIGDDRPSLENALEELQAKLISGDAEQLREATEKLDKTSEGFAERRMQAAMVRALAGRKVDELG